MADIRSEGSRSWRAFLAALIATREVVLTLAQVALFFSIFLFILQFSLPSGTGLRSVYGDALANRTREATAALISGEEYDLGPVATLTAVTRRVKDRPADGVAWNDSDQGMEFQDYHAIQTLSRSGATITFQDENQLWLDENSLVVIKRPTKGPARSRRASLTVLGGKVRGSVRAKPGKGKGHGLDVEVAGGSAQIRSSSGEATEFSLQVNPDQTSTLSVLSGLAQIEKAGRTVQLGPHQALSIDASGALSEPIAIPDPPAPVGPDDGFVYTAGPSTPPLEFSWGESPGADAYRLVIARDPDFAEVVFDSRTGNTRTRPANLAPGRYHWRLAAAADQAEGDFTRARSVEIVGDTDPPALTVDLPQAPVASPSLTVRGVSEPGSRILIGSTEVVMGPDGRFEHPIELVAGPNLIVIEAVDRAGNVTYHSQYVYAKY